MRKTILASVASAALLAGMASAFANPQTVQQGGIAEGGRGGSAFGGIGGNIGTNVSPAVSVNALSGGHNHTTGGSLNQGGNANARGGNGGGAGVLQRAWQVQ